MLIEYNPYFLQDNWLVNNEIPFDIGPDKDLNFIKDLLAIRKQPPRLDMACRLKIIQQLGYNTMSKVKAVPLPRALKDFILFKHSPCFGDDKLVDLFEFLSLQIR